MLLDGRDGSRLLTRYDFELFLEAVLANLQQLASRRDVGWQGKAMVPRGASWIEIEQANGE